MLPHAHRRVFEEQYALTIYTHCRYLPQMCVCVACCSMLQHVAVCCSVLQCVRCRYLHYAAPHTATHCNTLQHTVTHCNTLQHTATHCNTLQHTATHCTTQQHTTPLFFCKIVTFTHRRHFEKHSLLNIHTNIAHVRPRCVRIECCNVLQQHVAVHCNLRTSSAFRGAISTQYIHTHRTCMSQMCAYRMLQCVAACCSALHLTHVVGISKSLLPQICLCIAYCSMLQCVAVCHSVL